MLASAINNFDIIFIQELPWQLMRHAPSGFSVERDPVIGTTIHPDWGPIVINLDLQNEGVDNPMVAVYVHKCLKGLRPSYYWDIIDHWGILVFSLGWGKDLLLLANVYSDKQHTMICLLYEWMIEWPSLFFMGGILTADTAPRPPRD